PRYSPLDVDTIATQLHGLVAKDARAEAFYDGYRARLSVLFHSNIEPEHCVAGEIFKAGVSITTADDGTGRHPRRRAGLAQPVQEPHHHPAVRAGIGHASRRAEPWRCRPGRHRAGPEAGLALRRQVVRGDGRERPGALWR